MVGLFVVFIFNLIFFFFFVNYCAKVSFFYLSVITSHCLFFFRDRGCVHVILSPPYRFNNSFVFFGEIKETKTKFYNKKFCTTRSVYASKRLYLYFLKNSVCIDSEHCYVCPDSHSHSFTQSCTSVVISPRRVQPQVLNF